MATQLLMKARLFGWDCNCRRLKQIATILSAGAAQRRGTTRSGRGQESRPETDRVDRLPSSCPALDS